MVLYLASFTPNPTILQSLVKDGQAWDLKLLCFKVTHPITTISSAIFGRGHSLKFCMQFWAIEWWVFFFSILPKKKYWSYFLSCQKKKEKNEREKSVWDLIAQTWEQRHCHTIADDSPSPSHLGSKSWPLPEDSERQDAIVKTVYLDANFPDINLLFTPVLYVVILWFMKE